MPRMTRSHGAVDAAAAERGARSGVRARTHFLRSPRCSASRLERRRSSASFKRHRTVPGGMSSRRAISVGSSPSANRSSTVERNGSSSSLTRRASSCCSSWRSSSSAEEGTSRSSSAAAACSRAVRLASPRHRSRAALVRTRRSHGRALPSLRGGWRSAATHVSCTRSSAPSRTRLRASWRTQFAWVRRSLGATEAIGYRDAARSLALVRTDWGRSSALRHRGIRLTRTSAPSGFPPLIPYLERGVRSARSGTRAAGLARPGSRTSRFRNRRRFVRFLGRGDTLDGFCRRA
jgi:hypothetical protein